MRVIKNYFSIVYLLVIAIIILLNFTGFELISTNAKFILYILYFAVTSLGIYSIYVSEKIGIRNLTLLVLPFLALFLPGPILRFVPLLTGVSLIFIPRFRPLRFIGSFIYSIIVALALLITLLGLLFGGFGKITILESVNSPNGNLRLVSIDSDEGALGGSTTVRVERLYFGIAKRNQKMLYYGHWGEHPTMKWIDNRTVLINGREMDIYNDSTWDTKN